MRAALRRLGVAWLRAARRPAETAPAAAAGLAGAALVLASTVKYGPAIGPDSINYIAAARHLLAGEGFLAWDGTPFALWPPLFPMLLSGAGLAGLDVVAAARFLNAACFAGTIALSAACAGRCTRSAEAAALAGALMIVSPVLRLSPLVDAHRWMLAEPPFLFLVMLFLLRARRMVQRPTPANLVIAGGIAAAATMTRYIGVTLILCGGLLVVFFSRPAGRRRVRRRLAAAALFGCVASLPLCVWLARNWMQTGTLTGERLPPDITLWGSLSAAGEILASWCVPFGGRLALPGTAVLAGFGVFGAAGGLFLLKSFTAPQDAGTRALAWNSADAPRPGNGCFSRRDYVIPLLGFIAIYTPAVVALASRTWVTLQSRMLSPIYAPMVVLAVLAADRICWGIEGERGSGRRRLRANARKLLGAAAAVIVLAGAWRSAGWIRGLVRNGAGGLSTSAWHESPIVRYLRTHPLDGPVFANSPEMYLLTEAPVRGIPAIVPGGGCGQAAGRGWGEARRSVSSSQRLYIDDAPPGSRRAARRLDEFTRLLAAGKVCYVVCFDPESAPEWFPVRRPFRIDGLSQYGDVQVVAEFLDGAVYRISGHAEPASGAVAMGAFVGRQ